MPCSDGGWGEAIAREERERDLAALKDNVNMLTDYLCTVLTRCEQGREIVDLFGNDIADWWKFHKVADLKRVQDKLQIAGHSTLVEIEQLLDKNKLIGKK